MIAAQQSADEAGEEAPLGGAGAAPRDDLNLGKGEVPQRPRRRERPRGRRRRPPRRERANEEEGLDHVAGGRRPPAEAERGARKGVRATAMSWSLHSSK